jgi:hypothetical protein
MLSWNILKSAAHLTYQIRFFLQRLLT